MDNVTTAKASPPSKRPSKSVIVRMGAIIIVVLLLGAGFWYWEAHRTKPPVVSTVPQLSATDLQNQVYNDIYNREYANAITLIKGQKTAAQTSSQLLLITVYVGKGDTQSALAVYAALNKANQLNPTALTSAAQLAEQQKDYRTAIQYYQEAKAKTNTKTGIDPADDIAGYNAAIAELQKKL